MMARINQVRILRVDGPNQNGIVFSLESISSLLEKGVKVKGQIFDYNQNTYFDERKASHEVFDLKIKDGYLVGAVGILDNENGDDLMSMINLTGAAFCVQGTGKTRKNSDGVTELYEFNVISIDAINPGSAGELQVFVPTDLIKENDYDKKIC